MLTHRSLYDVSPSPMLRACSRENSRTANAGDDERPAKKIKINPTDVSKETDVSSLPDPLLGSICQCAGITLNYSVGACVFLNVFDLCMCF